MIGSVLGESAEPVVVGTQSVSRALSILQAFTPSRPGVTGPEIASRFGYSIPTAHRLLRALEAERFLVFDRVSHQYSPGPEILRLSGVILERDGMVPLTLGSLDRLRDLTGHTAALHWMLGHRRTCVQEAVSLEPFRLAPTLGSSYPLARGAAGKALLLAVDDATRQAVLEDPDSALPLSSVELLLAELAEAAQRGWAQSFGETIVGAASIAAPVMYLNQGVAALSITGPAAHFGPEEMASAGAALLVEIAFIGNTVRGRAFERRTRGA